MGSKPQHLSYWYLIPPLLTLLLILPPILSLPPFLPKGTTNPNIVQWLIVLPFYGGVLAAPGYVYAWAGHVDSRPLSTSTRCWVAVSLVLAVLASLAGTFLSLLTVIVAPFAFWSFIMAIKLLRRFARRSTVS